MQFFIDTANLDDIREAAELGILDGVTTNPSLMAKEGISELQEGQRIHMRVVPGAKGLEATSIEIKHEG